MSSIASEDEATDGVNSQESRPLLGHTTTLREQLALRGTKWYQTSSPAVVVGLASAILFCLVLSATLALIPMVRLMEDILCRQHYGTTDPIDEDRCKVDAVQNELVWLGAISSVIDSVVGKPRLCCLDGASPASLTCRQAWSSPFPGAFSQTGRVTPAGCG